MTHLSTADTSKLFEAVGAGIFVFDLDASRTLRFVSVNSICSSMYELTEIPDAGSRLDAFFSENVRSHYCAQLKRCLERNASVDDALWIECGGRKCCYRVRMVPVFGKEETLISRIMATSVDITEQKELEEQLNNVSARLEAIVDSTHDAIVSIDENHAIQTFNQAAERLFKYDRSAMIGKSIDLLLPESARRHHAAHIQSFGDSQVKSRAMETRAEVTGLCSDGNTFPAEVAIAKITVQGAKEYTAIVRDISVQMRLLDELKLRATTDALTNISNRRHLIEVAQVEIERCRRYSHALTFLLLDIDDFKLINDNYGHVVGDEVLRQLGKVLEKCCRMIDLPARWGGEEFCLLMPETSLEPAYHFCERLLEDIRCIHHQIPELGERVVTASIGLADYSNADAGFDQLVHQADEAMYRAKRSGKNKVCLARA